MTSSFRQKTLQAQRAGAVLQATAALLWLPQAWLIALAVQAIADGQGVPSIAPLAAGVLLVGIVRAWLDGQGVLRAQIAARVQLSHLREQVVQSLMQASPLDRGQVPSGQAASAVAEQAGAIVPWLSRYQSAMLKVRWVPLVIVCAVAWFSWIAALILIVAAPLIPLFMAIVGWRARSASEEQMLQLGGMNAFLLDRLRGLSTLRALAAVDATAQRLADHADNLRVRTMKVLRIAFLSSAVLELFSALGVAMVAVYIGFHLLDTLTFGAWGSKLSLDAALFILLLSPAFFEPLRELSAVWHDRADGEAALNVLEGLSANAMPLPGARSMQADLAPDRGAPTVELHDVHVQVPGSSAMIDPVTLHVAAGERVALWAPSGAGKSVLLAQLAGLVPLERGEIRVDGQALNDASAQRLRQRMAWMGQRAHVFAGSVRRNVSLGREDVSDADVQRATQLASLGEVLAQRTAVALGEGGMGLSGGEAVRLALARLAVHSHAGLLLVDEPTAHLDPQMAEQVTQGLLQIAHGKTLIVATHDHALAQRMDRIVPLMATANDWPDAVEPFEPLAPVAAQECA